MYNVYLTWKNGKQLLKQFDNAVEAYHYMLDLYSFIRKTKKHYAKLLESKYLKQSYGMYDNYVNKAKEVFGEEISLLFESDIMKDGIDIDVENV